MAPVEPDEGLPLDLLRRAAQLTASVTELALDHLAGRPTAGFTHLGTGVAEVDATFEALEARTRKVHYSLNPVLLFDPWDPAIELDRRSRERGAELRTIVSERNLAVNPLLSSMDPTVHVGHAVMTMIVIDRERVVVPGPVTGDGSVTVWSATLPLVLDPALALWDEVWAGSRPVLAPGAAAPFTPRQVQIALLMTQGHKDVVIARAVGVSVRTVVSEVGYLADRLGARSRVEAVQALRRGADRRKIGILGPGF